MLPLHRQLALLEIRQYTIDTEGQCWNCRSHPVSLASQIPFCLECDILVGYRYDPNWYPTNE